MGHCSRKPGTERRRFFELKRYVRADCRQHSRSACGYQQVKTRLTRFAKRRLSLSQVIWPTDLIVEELTGRKLCLNMLLPMPNQPATANAHQLASPFPGPQPWEAPDPLPVMRRELKLLLIEMNVLRVEVEQLRAIEREARSTEEFLSASVNRIMESRDSWRREAERLHALIAQVPPWSLLWSRCVEALKAWRQPTDRGLHCA